MESKNIAIEIVKILDEKKAKDIKVIEISELTIIADYFVIASGTSGTHAKSLADDVEYEMNKRHEIRPHGVEGRATGWTLLDYSSVLVHVFEGESREYYNLERLWGDASLLDISGIITD